MVGNLMNVFTNAAVIAIVGLGMTLAIASGNFDLSVGATAAFSACIAFSLVPLFGVPVGIIAGVIVGALIGLGNGLIITELRVPRLLPRWRWRASCAAQRCSSPTAATCICRAIPGTRCFPADTFSAFRCRSSWRWHWPPSSVGRQSHPLWSLHPGGGQQRQHGQALRRACEQGHLGHLRHRGRLCGAFTARSTAPRWSRPALASPWGWSFRLSPWSSWVEQP